MKKSERASQTRRELDLKFQLANLNTIQVPPRSGWIRAIRTGLGMSQKTLATRLGVGTVAVGKLERSELSRTISMGRLDEIARALECRLVYVLIPNVSLEDTVQKQAQRRSAKLLRYVTTTMQLEDQNVSADQQSGQIKRYPQQIIESGRLWDKD